MLICFKYLGKNFELSDISRLEHLDGFEPATYRLQSLGLKDRHSRLRRNVVAVFKNWFSLARNQGITLNLIFLLISQVSFGIG